jgi:predicted transcriptional regulator
MDEVKVSGQKIDKILSAMSYEPKPIRDICKRVDMTEADLYRAFRFMMRINLISKVPICVIKKRRGRPSTVGWRKTRLI